MKSGIINIAGKWMMNVLIAVDQLFNALTCGDPDETISSRIGKIKEAHGGMIPRYHPVCRIIDWGLEKIDKNHCIEAIEEDEGEEAVITE